MRCDHCSAPLGENGLTDRCVALECKHSKPLFDDEVIKFREALSIEMVNRLSNNDMPACFGVTRSQIVAVAGLLIEALHQNQSMAGELRHYRKQGAPGEKH